MTKKENKFNALFRTKKESKINRLTKIVFSFIVRIVIVLALIEGVFFNLIDDTPTLEFTRSMLDKKGAKKTIRISNRAQMKKTVLKRSVLKYSYRTFVIERDIKIKGEMILHQVNGEVRCYPEYRSYNPFSAQTENDFCSYHELKRQRLTKEVKRTEDAAPR